jgi:uncharacterized repeat protein (TIGR03803 family)
MHLVSTRIGFLFAAALLAGVSSAATASASTFTVLYDFCQKGGKFVCSDGKNPSASLVTDSAGNLYGTASAGGTTNTGVVFELVKKPQKYVYKVLHSFDCGETCAEGGTPITPLIIDTAGNLYGTAVAGGSDFGGTVFELSPNADRSAWTYKVLTSFCSQNGAGCVNGMVPESALSYAQASAGAPYDGVSPLYGSTLEGGLNGAGMVYSLVPSGGTWTASLVYSFCSTANCADGQFPVGQVAVDPSGGTLYGTTNGGGNQGNGVAFKVAVASGRETVLHAFCSKIGCTDGSGANSGFTLGGDGKLYGATPVGGRNSSGTVFALDPHTGREKVLYSFCPQAGCADGIGPVGPLVQSGGALIGTAGGGDAGSHGVIYAVGAAHEEVVEHTFCQEADCTDGSLPLGVVVDGAGNIFGATERGGHRNDGVLYELTP